MRELSTPRPADRADLVRIFIFLVVVFAAAIAGVATVWGMTNRSGDVALEVAKGCIQVAGVAVIGGIVTWLFSRHLRRQEAEAKARDDELAELRRRNLAAADLRRRQDKFLRTMLNDTLTAYNDVKRIRRLLRGKLDEPDHKRLAEELSEDQLEFERLREIAKLVNDDRIPVVFTWNTRSYEAQPVALVQMFDMIE